MARLLQISLSHFRSHKRWSFKDAPAAVALHGPNGAGKTNILEAISMLSPGRGLRRAQAEEIIRRPEAIGWKVAATLGGRDPHEVATWVAAPGERRKVEIDGKTASQTALGEIAPMVWLTPAMDRLWMEGAAERRRFLDRITLSFEPGHGDRTLAYEKAMRERNRLLKDGIGDDGWFAALEAQMAHAGVGVARARAETTARLAAAQDGAETAFPRADLALEGALEAGFTDAIAAGRDPRAAEDAARDAFAETLAANRRADAQAGRTLHGPHRSDLSAIFAAKGVEARLCSTGEQKALLISLVLASARALSEDRGAGADATPILLLDEVAAHLDEDRRAALYDEIAALGAQAWMTGTGAELFAALGPRGALVAVEPEA